MRKNNILKYCRPSDDVYRETLWLIKGEPLCGKRSHL